MKGRKEDGGGVFCCIIGAKRRLVGRVGDDARGSTGDEGGGRGGCVECCCNANGSNCSRERVDCFFAGDMGTYDQPPCGR